MCFGVVLFGVSSVLVSGISIARQTRWIALYTCLAAAVNIALNFALIPLLGQVGAALATLIAYAALSGLYYYRAQILYPTPYRGDLVLATLAAGLVLMPIGAIAFDDLATASAVKIAATAAFIVALRVIGVARPGDLRRAIAWLRGRSTAGGAP